MHYTYYVTSDTTCDLPREFYEEEFAVLPMPIIVDDVFYNDVSDISAKEFYDKMRGGAVAKTSLINAATAIEYFTPILEKGYDILHICFSSALSGTYNAMLEAREELLDKFPNRKVIVVDSKLSSLGEGILVYYTLKKRAEGATISELAAYAEDIKSYCQEDFTVDSLKYLLRTGRVSMAAALVGTAIQVKPILISDADGQLIPSTKVVGRKQALKTLTEKFAEKSNDMPADKLVIIGHGDCYEEACSVRNMLEQKYGRINTLVADIGPIIGAHTGPGLVGIFYAGSVKK